MAPRELTPEEAQALGLKPPEPKRRELSADEVKHLGLKAPEATDNRAFLEHARDKIGAAGRGFLDLTTFGHADELSAAGDAAVDALTTDKKLGDAYGERLKEYRELHKRSQKEEKAASLTGQGLGIGALMLASRGKAGPQSLAGAVARGGAGGAVYGAGSSEADVREGQFGKLLMDSLGGGVAGLAGGAIGYGVSKAAPTVLRAAGRGLEKLGLKQARRVLQGGADQRSGTKKPLSDEAAREALRSGTIVPFGTTEGAARRIEARSDALGKVYGEVVDELERRGVPGPNSRALANKLLSEADNLEPLLMDQAPARAYRKAAEAVLDASELGERRGMAQTGRLGLKQAEALKRDLQQAAKAEYQKLGGSKPLGKAKKGIAAAVRESVEDAVEEAGNKAAPNSDVALLAESFRPVKARLARLLEANEFAQSGASRALQRNAMGLPEKIALATTAMTAGPGAAIAGAGGLGITRSLLNRGASTVASGAYGAGRAASLLGEQALRIPERAVYGARLGGALGRSSYDAAEPSEEELRQAALIEALRKKR